MAEFEIKLRKLKLLYKEKKELLDAQKLRELEEHIQQKEKKGFESGYNMVLNAWTQYLEHLNVASEASKEMSHKDVVDKVSKWFAEKGYTMGREVSFIIKGLDFRVDILLYKPKEWVGVECKGSGCGSSEIIKGLGQVLVYRESFNLAYLASSNSLVSSEAIKELAKKEGFGIIIVKDSIEEVVKPKRRFTVAAKCTQS